MSSKKLIIEGEKVYLTPSIKKDLPAFVKWINEPKVIQFTHARPYNLEQEEAWFERVQSNADEPLFSIFTNNEKRLIGNCGIHFNMPRNDQFDGKTFIGIMIGEKLEWGKGYGTDALKTLLHRIKEVSNESEVYLTVYVDHKAAISLYEKCGFGPVIQRTKPNRFGVMKEEFVMSSLL